MKLELKHLAPYLPYKLGIGSCHSHNEKRIYSQLKLTNDYGLSNGVGDLINGKTTCGTPIKPILRPLSDLTKEIKDSKNRTLIFVETLEIGEDDNGTEYDYGNIKMIRDLKQIAKFNSFLDVQYLPYILMQDMLRLHFDVFGLIEKGLAIDINILNN